MHISVSDNPSGAHDFNQHCPCSGCRAVRWSERCAFGWSILACILFIAVTVVVANATSGDESVFPALIALVLPFVIYQWKKPRAEVLVDSKRHSRKAFGTDPKSRNTQVLSQVEGLLAEDEATLASLIAQMTEVANLSPEDSRLLEWLLSLPEEHRQIVDDCTAKGIPVTPDNFDEVLAQIEAVRTV